MKIGRRRNIKLFNGQDLHGHKFILTFEGPLGLVPFRHYICEKCSLEYESAISKDHHAFAFKIDGDKVDKIYDLESCSQIIMQKVLG